MRKPLKEPSRSRARLPLLIAVVLVLAAIFISLFRDMGVVDLVRLRNTEEQLRAEVEQLRRENNELKHQVEGLRGNPAVIEGEARGMGLIHEKEQVIVVPSRQKPGDGFPARSGARKP